MELVNGTRFKLHAGLAHDPAGKPLLVLMAKARYRFARDAHGRAQLADTQSEFLPSDCFDGEPGLSAPRIEADFVPYKPRCDVVVHGNAHAPDGNAVRTLDVGLAVGTREGNWRKTLRVYGERRWHRRVGLWSLSEPEPFVTLPISYDRAFGGSFTHAAIGSDDPSEYTAHPGNLVGRGYATGRFLALLDGATAHNIEAEDDRVVAPDRCHKPAGLGPLARNWQPRLHFGGTYDEDWKRSRFPALPQDFDARYFQCAPEDQQIDYPSGGETIGLMNLTQGGGITTFQLPRLDLPAVVLRRDRSRVPLQPVVDTIVIDAERQEYDLTWRASAPLRRGLNEVLIVAAGSVCRRWWRSRVFGAADCGCGGFETDDDDLSPVTEALDEPA